MAYAQRKEGDVFVVLHRAGHLECCGCLLMESSSFRTQYAIGMIGHLRLHIESGHRVPSMAIRKIQRDFGLVEESE